MAHKLAYIVFYDNNRIDPRGGDRHMRCAAFDSFAKAYNAAAEDVDYFMAHGAHIQREWYNDTNIRYANTAQITMRMPNDELLNINIVPSYVN